ncbi:MAG: 1-acyl-sn-glycerol-3-phosphate acyltransferase [Treponema sp.]|nr:1-acyl-sn-glycerol-3-phosphate acyltransferase [Treponema sp.]
MTNAEIAGLYDASDVPPVKNWLYYGYAALMKLFFFVFFGAGSVVLAIVVFPVVRIFCHPKWRFQRAARALVSATFRFFLALLRMFGLVHYSVHDRERFCSLHSKIVVANHPSLIDVIFIISLIPNADCIVRGGLTRTPLAGVIRQLYIVNSLDYDEMIALSKASLATGTNLIIFPEGTRTPRHGTNPYKKGAARIAYETGCDVQPVYIGGNDKYGLGKHDAFFSFNRTERYRYDIYPLEEIKIAHYAALEPQRAAKQLTEAMHTAIATAAFNIDGRKV